MRRFIFATLCASLWGTQQVLASTAHLHVVASYPDYALHVGHTVTDISLENGSRTEIRQSFLGVSVAEDITDWLKIRLAGGNAGYTTDGGPRNDQFDPTGAFVSLAFEPYFAVSRNVGLAGNIAYRHVRVKDEIGAEELRYTLNQFDFEVSGVFHLHPTFSLELGVNALLIDGRERLISTTGTTTVDFDEEDTGSAFARGVFHVGNNGHVGITGMAGAQDSLSIFFKYAY